MYVLGIETSCDETSASIVKSGREILSNVVASSLKFHKIYGGVIPEIASRMQLETIAEVTALAIKQARIKAKDIDLVCVTKGPGLLGSLTVGISFAKSLCLGLSVPLLGVDHLHSHIYANFLNGAGPIRLPLVALVVSGGHTALYYVYDFNKITILGRTHDDACGESFDKVAKILKLGYPGGPLIEKLAGKGNPKKIRFGCSDTTNPLDFSFSGIKTAVLYYVQKKKKLDKNEASDIAASFQNTVIEVLMKKSFWACRMKKVNRLVIGGGVAANNRLQKMFTEGARNEGIHIFLPSKALCMDNAAMVAGLGYRLFKKGQVSDLNLNLSLD